MKKIRLVPEEGFLNIDSREALEDYFKSIKDDSAREDRLPSDPIWNGWKECYANEIGVIGIENYPLLLAEMCKDLKIRKLGYMLPIKEIDPYVRENFECIENTGVFVVIPGSTKMEAWPTREIAYRSILERAGDLCPTMLRLENKSSKKALPLEELCRRLTQDLELSSEICKVMFRYGKISTIRSSAYVPIDEEELTTAFEKQLKNDFENAEFESGKASQEFLVLEFKLNATLLEQSFLQTLKDLGFQCDEISSYVRLVTSSVGNSSVISSCYYAIDDMRFELGGGVSMAHINDASVEKFVDLSCGIAQTFTDNEQRIEELGNMPINDVANVILTIREKYPLPKNTTEIVCSQLNVPGTGIDVYIAINDIIDRYVKAENAGPTKYLELMQLAAKLMYLPFDKIDRGEAWQ